MNTIQDAETFTEYNIHTPLKIYYFIYRLHKHNTSSYTEVEWLIKDMCHSYRFATEVNVVIEWNEGMATVYNL